MTIDTIPAFINLGSIFWLVKFVVVSLNLLFSLLVLRHLIELQDNYRAKVYLVFLLINVILVFYSISIFLFVLTEVL